MAMRLASYEQRFRTRRSNKEETFRGTVRPQRNIKPLATVLAGVYSVEFSFIKCITHEDGSI